MLKSINKLAIRQVGALCILALGMSILVTSCQQESVEPKSHKSSTRVEPAKAEPKVVLSDDDDDDEDKPPKDTDGGRDH